MQRETRCAAAGLGGARLSGWSGIGGSGKKTADADVTPQHPTANRPASRSRGHCIQPRPSCPPPLPLPTAAREAGPCRQQTGLDYDVRDTKTPLPPQPYLLPDT